MFENRDTTGFLISDREIADEHHDFVRFGANPCLILGKLKYAGKNSRKYVVICSDDGSRQDDGCGIERLSDDFHEVWNYCVNWSHDQREQRRFGDKLLTKENTDFETWKKLIIDAINAHPAMQPESTCCVAPSLDRWNWQKMYDEGESVQEIYAQSDEHFNVHGW